MSLDTAGGAWSLAPELFRLRLTCRTLAARVSLEFTGLCTLRIWAIGDFGISGYFEFNRHTHQANRLEARTRARQGFAVVGAQDCRSCRVLPRLRIRGRLRGRHGR